MRWPPRISRENRPCGTVHVAACIVRDGDGRVLLAQRRADQMSGGYWEIPGGKIEPGETARAAAARELFEETGLTGTQLKKLSSFSHQFTTGRVVLNTFVADRWSGTPQSRERQRLVWADLTRPQVAPLLPSNRKILNLLTLPDRVLCIAPPTRDTSDWARRSVDIAQKTGAGALMLSSPLTMAQNNTLARRLNQHALRHGLSIWQSGMSGGEVGIRIVSDPSVLPNTPTSSAIYGVLTCARTGLSDDRCPQADILIIPFSADAAQGAERVKAVIQTTAAPVYAVVTNDSDQQKAALAAGASGLILDDGQSLAKYWVASKC